MNHDTIELHHELQPASAAEEGFPVTLASVTVSAQLKDSPAAALKYLLQSA